MNPGSGSSLLQSGAADGACYQYLAMPIMFVSLESTLLSALRSLSPKENAAKEEQTAYTWVHLLHTQSSAKKLIKL